MNLQKVSFLRYPCRLNRPNLSGILLAAIIDFPLSRGTFGIEIRNRDNEVIVQSVFEVSHMNKDLPACFPFDPILNSDKEVLQLIVFAHNTDGPIRIFEWNYHTLGGLGPTFHKAFAGYQFK
jgi:hypothetical protein